MDKQTKSIVEKVSAMLEQWSLRQAMEMADEQVADHQQNLLDECQNKGRHLQERMARQKEQDVRLTKQLTVAKEALATARKNFDTHVRSDKRKLVAAEAPKNTILKKNPAETSTQQQPSSPNLQGQGVQPQQQQHGDAQGQQEREGQDSDKTAEDPPKPAYSTGSSPTPTPSKASTMIGGPAPDAEIERTRTSTPKMAQEEQEEEWEGWLQHMEAAQRANSPASVRDDDDTTMDSGLSEIAWEDEPGEQSEESRDPVKPAPTQLKGIKVQIKRLTEKEIRKKRRPTLHGRAAMTKLLGEKSPALKPGQLLGTRRNMTYGTPKPEVSPRALQRLRKKKRGYMSGQRRPEGSGTIRKSWRKRAGSRRARKRRKGRSKRAPRMKVKKQVKVGKQGTVEVTVNSRERLERRARCAGQETLDKLSSVRDI